MSKGVSAASRRGYNRQKYYLRNVGPFALAEMVERAITVKTRDGDIYVNLKTGEFVLQNNPQRVATATQVYDWAVEVYNAEDKVIAVAQHRRQRLEGTFTNRLRRVVLEPKAGKGIA